MTAQPKVLVAEDHALVIKPWWVEDVQPQLDEAALLGFTHMTSEGHLPDYEEDGCTDWDFIRVEPHA
jgi:hypothetical protein